MLLSEAWRLYAVDKQIEGFSPVTLRGYKIQHNLLIRYFGDVDLDGITLPALKAYLMESASHLKPSSLGHRIRFIRAFFRWAAEEGYAAANPARKLREPKLGMRVPKALSEEDTVLLQEACKTPLEHALIEFLYSTGCRIGEVRMLNRNSIDWDNRSCIVRGKGDKEREIYFSIKAAIWLKKYLAGRKDTDIALFVTQRMPHRMSIDALRYTVKTVAKRSEVAVRVYPHKLRHSYATHLLNNGAPMERIQTLLGHAKLETTLIYAQLAGPRRKAIYQK
ncbi:MAG TPA: tyrosine-type recombinase/integrase, partial [Syntrophomonas sp.]|nr:tyrosine-type recombinase/integrase [Syntrophomonas sp.]